MRNLVEAVERIGTMFRPTPIIRLADPAFELYAKLEFCNPVGSLKDRAAYWILQRAIAKGELTSDSKVVESSSGNFARSLALFCKQLGLPFVPVIDANILPSNERFLRAMCSTVVKVEVPDRLGGYLISRLAAVRQIAASDPNVFWTNQYENRDGVQGHYQLTGGELLDDLDRIDIAFIGVSSGGTITGLSNRLKERLPNIRIVAVDAEGSVIFGGPGKARHIPGIGASIVPDLLRDARIDDVVVVPEREAVAACLELRDRHGLFVGGSSGSVFAAIRRYGSKMSGRRKPRAVFLCADRGDAYADTIFDADWTSRLATYQ